MNIHPKRITSEATKLLKKVQLFFEVQLTIVKNCKITRAALPVCELC